jgi:hypothetical protein
MADFTDESHPVRDNFQSVKSAKSAVKSSRNGAILTYGSAKDKTGAGMGGCWAKAGARPKRLFCGNAVSPARGVLMGPVPTRLWQRHGLTAPAVHPSLPWTGNLKAPINHTNFLAVTRSTLVLLRFLTFAHHRSNMRTVTAKPSRGLLKSLSIPRGLFSWPSISKTKQTRCRTDECSLYLAMSTISCNAGQHGGMVGERGRKGNAVFAPRPTQAKNWQIRRLHLAQSATKLQ